jgi:hypothetical protein
MMGVIDLIMLAPDTSNGETVREKVRKKIRLFAN